MRCPNCNKRNSVAASKCSDCDYRFKRKPLPFQVKFLLGFFAALLLLWGVALALVPRLGDSQLVLIRTARSLAAGPKSQEDAAKMTGNFESVLQDFLKHFAGLSASELTKKLQADLPNSLFEVHIFDVLRTTKLVEVDNVLRVTDYLVWTKSGENRVLPVSGLEVFDNGTTITDGTKNYLVLLGHTASPTSHQPRIKIFLISSDEITDQTDKLLPVLNGEGTVNFGRNKQDILAPLSLLSIGQAQGLFSAKQREPAPIEDETLNYTFKWQGGRYWLQANRGYGQLFALYGLARCLKDPSCSVNYPTLIAANAKKALSNLKQTSQNELSFVILPCNENSSAKKRGSGKVCYLLSSPTLSARADLERRSIGNHSWVVSALEINSPVKPDKEEQIVLKNPSDIVPEPASEKTADTDAKKSLLEKPDRVKAEDSASEPSVKPTTTVNEESTADSAQVEADKEKTSSTTQADPAEYQSADSKTIVRNSLGKISLRRGPGTTYGIVQELDKGTAIQVLGQEKSWYKVRANGSEGFVYAGLLDYKQPDACTVATIKQSKKLTDSSNRKLASLQVGDRLVILGGIKDNKYKVQLANGKVGYVEKDALDVAIDAPPLVP